jgi:hypothetical protein
LPGDRADAGVDVWPVGIRHFVNAVQQQETTSLVEYGSHPFLGRMAEFVRDLTREVLRARQSSLAAIAQPYEEGNSAQRQAGDERFPDWGVGYRFQHRFDEHVAPQAHGDASGAERPERRVEQCRSFFRPGPELFATRGKLRNVLARIDVHVPQQVRPVWATASDCGLEGERAQKRTLSAAGLTSDEQAAVSPRENKQDVFGADRAGVFGALGGRHREGDIAHGKLVAVRLLTDIGAEEFEVIEIPHYCLAVIGLEPLHAGCSFALSYGNDLFDAGDAVDDLLKIVPHPAQPTEDGSRRLGLEPG